MAAIFISHSSNDNESAAEIAAWLKSKDHQSLFLDFDPESGISAGTVWEQKIYQELNRCQAVIALLTPSWLESKWCFAEFTSAREKGKTIFPVIVKPCNISQVFPNLLQHIDLTDKKEEGYLRLENALKDHGLDPSDLFGWDARRPPYPGLQSFEEEDAGVFFGRREKISESRDILNSLRRAGHESPHFVLFLGSSGSGKSSLIRAGLIPLLKKDPTRWLPLRPFRPLEDPLKQLAEAWAATLSKFGPSPHWQEIESLLSRDAEKQPADGSALIDLARDLRVAANQTEATVLLSIDQAEELFDERRSAKATSFLRLLRAAIESSQLDLMCIATMRSEFLGTFQTHPILRKRTYGRDFYALITVDPMPTDSFAEVIQGPARVSGILIQPALTAEMIKDTSTEDALPLLAFALHRLFEKCQSKGEFTLEDYARLGKLEGSVEQAARDLMATRSFRAPAELQALKEAFIPRLVRMTESGAFVRRVAYRDELPVKANRLIGLLINSRLLVTNQDSDGRDTVEVAHEALFRVWSLLKRWLLAEKDFLSYMERFQQQVSYWASAGRKRDALLSGSLLEEAERYLTARELVLTDDQHRFLDNSRMQREATRLWDDLELFGHTLSERDLKALTNLSNATPLVKEAFVASLMASEPHSRKFNRRTGVVTRAVVGLDLSLRTLLLQQYVLPTFGANPESETQRAAFGLALSLEAATGEVALQVCRMLGQESGWYDSLWIDADGSFDIGLVGGDSRVQSQLFSAAVPSMTEEQVSEAIDTLVQGNGYDSLVYSMLRLLRHRFSTAQRGRVLDALVQMQGSQGAQLLPFVQDVGLPPLEEKEWERKIVDGVLNGGARDSFGFPRLHFELTSEQVEKLLRLTLSPMSIISSRLEFLFTALPASEREKIIENLVSGIAALSERSHFNELDIRNISLCLSETAKTLEPEKAHTAFERILSTMQGLTSPPPLNALALSIGALPIELTSEQAQQAMQPLLAVIQLEGTKEYGGLVEGLETIWRKVRPDQAQQALEPLRILVETSTQPDLILNLVTKLNPLTVGMTSKRARALIEPLLQRLRADRVNDDGVLWSIADQLRALANTLDATDAKEVCETLIAAIKKTSDIDQIALLLRSVNVLAAVLTEGQITNTLDYLVAVGRRKRSTDAMEGIRDSLAALAGRLSPAQAERKILGLLPAMRTTSSPQALYSIGIALDALLPGLGQEEGQRVAEQLRAAFSRKRSPAGLALVARGLHSLSQKIKPEQTKQIAKAAERILQSISSSNDDESTTLLVNSLVGLSHELSDRQFVEVTFAALKYPNMAGEATSLLLGALRARYPEAKELANGSLWDAVVWAENKFPEFELGVTRKHLSRETNLEPQSE